jgi:hypothetical protein
VPGTFVQFSDPLDPLKGFVDFTGDPRFSNGYADARHLPGILVENHSLKPYRQRVLGTYVFMQTCLRLLGTDAAALRAAVRTDSASRPSTVTLAWKATQEKTDVAFKAVDWRIVPAPVSGARRIEYLGRPKTIPLPRYKSGPAVQVSRAKAYWIPGAWTDVIARLRLHGVEMEEIREPRRVEVERYRLSAPKLGEPFEGRVPMTAKTTLEPATETYPPGSVRVTTDQARGDLATLLLEPQSPDSFFQWGFFASVLNATEYIEDYAMEPLAEEMLAKDPALKAEFEAALGADESFAKSPEARLLFFYRRTPFADARHLVYPVTRER